MISCTCCLHTFLLRHMASIKAKCIHSCGVGGGGGGDQIHTSHFDLVAAKTFHRFLSPLFSLKKKSISLWEAFTPVPFFKAWRKPVCQGHCILMDPPGSAAVYLCLTVPVHNNRRIANCQRHQRVRFPVSSLAILSLHTSVRVSPMYRAYCQAIMVRIWHTRHRNQWMAPTRALMVAFKPRWGH